MVAPEQPVRVVFDDRHTVAGGDLEDAVHLAGDTGVVDDQDGARAIGDQRLEPRLVQVERVGTDVAKTGRAPRRTNAFSVETNVNDGAITSSPGPTSSSRAAISSACVHDVVRSAFGTPRTCSQHVLAAPREGAVARQPRALDRFAHVVELAARNGRTMEGDLWRRGDGHGREPTRRSEPPTGHDTPMRISARSRSITRSHARSSGRGKASSRCTSAVRRLYRDANMAGTRSETNEDTRVMRKPAPATLSISSRRA